MFPAIVLLEFDSIAVGISASDAMAKRAPLSTLHIGSVQPGKFLVLAGGDVASVDEARTVGRETGINALTDELYLPEVHSDVVRSLTGERRKGVGDALGIIETTTVAATIGAADAGIKGASVNLLEVLMADGLGGKGYALFAGDVSDVEAAVEIGSASLPNQGLLVARIVIPQAHPDILDNLHASPHFGSRVRSYRPESQ